MKTASLLAACLLLGAPMTAHAIPNPAAVFCLKMSGKPVIARLPDGGTIGLCRLPNNRIVEEWTLFRMFGGKVPTPRDNPFR